MYMQCVRTVTVRSLARAKPDGRVMEFRVPPLMSAHSTRTAALLESRRVLTSLGRSRAPVMRAGRAMGLRVTTRMSVH